AKWRGTNGKTELAWSGWLPHLDLNVSRGLTSASHEHAEFFELLKQKGTLNLRAQLDLDLMLHPKTQPGAKLDYEYPSEIVTVILKSREKLSVTTAAAPVKRVSSHEYRITLTPAQNQWLPLEVSLPTGGSGPDLE